MPFLSGVWHNGDDITSKWNSLIAINFDSRVVVVVIYFMVVGEFFFVNGHPDVFFVGRDLSSLSIPEAISRLILGPPGGENRIYI